MTGRFIQKHKSKFRAVEDYSHAGLPVDAAALLLIEVDGHPAQVQEDADRVEALCRQHGASSIRVARDAAERTKVWEARRSALSALAKLKPALVLEDATVPRSKVPAMVKAVGEISREYRLSMPRSFIPNASRKPWTPTTSSTPARSSEHPSGVG